MNRLTELANKHQCDKGTEAFEKHGYTEEYIHHIPETGKYTLLEIGVWKGDSLRMWREYNPEMNILGIDIDPLMTEHPDFKLYIGDSSDEELLENVINENQEFDFIIDDGSHDVADILIAFRTLYPHLKKNGYYFIEDLHSAYADRVETLSKIIQQLITDKNYRFIKLTCNSKLLMISK